MSPVARPGWFRYILSHKCCWNVEETKKTHIVHFMNLVFPSRIQDKDVGSGARPMWVRVSGRHSLACTREGGTVFVPMIPDLWGKDSDGTSPTQVVLRMQ